MGNKVNTKDFDSKTQETDIEGLIKKLEASLSGRTLKNYEIGNTWLLLFNFGMLFWLISNFDKFKIKTNIVNAEPFRERIANKELLIACLIVISLAILCFSIRGLVRYLGEFAKNAAFDKIGRLESKMSTLSSDKESAKKKTAMVKEIVSLLTKGYNMQIAKLWFDISKLGLIFSAVGVLLFMLYFIIFVCNYL